MADPRTQVSQVERALLCDLFDAVGPAAPTLCRGWTTHHLAAHLKIREGNPVEQARNAIPGQGDAMVAAAVETQDYAELVEKVRNGPPLLTVYSLPKADTSLNALEFFIHHEDVRRAAEQWEPRVLDDWAEDQLWSRITSLAKLFLRRSPTGIIVERSDTGDSVTMVKRDDSVTLTGLPSEISLYLYGRRRVATTELSGSDEAVAAFTRKKSAP